MKIVVSGGFNAERIRAFEAARVPVDAYGVGSALIRGSNDFTADVVLVDGRPCAKVGREYRPNPRLTPVRFRPAARSARARAARGAARRRRRGAAARAAGASSTGPTRRPPSASWSGSAGGIAGIAAATLIAS